MKVKKLIKYIKAEESKLLKLLHKELLKMDYTVLTNQNEEYLYGFPREDDNIPVVLISHVDTVHKNPPDHVFFDNNYRVLWSPEGLGADDRAGVFATMEIIKSFRVPVIFTTGEESGGKGAKALIKDMPDNPNNYKMLVQLDRRGINDCVFYRNDSDKFHKYIEEYGFKKETGSFSDISVIGPAWKVNSVNLSIGYIDEHRSTEHLFVDRMIDTINKVCEILSHPVPDFEYKEKTYTTYTTWWDDKVWDRDKKQWVTKGGGSDRPKSVYGISTRCEVCGCYVSYTDERWEEDFMFCKECYEEYIGGGQSDLFDCSICKKPVDEKEEYWIDDADLICKSCFEAEKGYSCENCGKDMIPEMIEIDLAVELQLCDECYEVIFIEQDNEEEKVDKLVVVK